MREDGVWAWHGWALVRADGDMHERLLRRLVRRALLRRPRPRAV